MNKKIIGLLFLSIMAGFLVASPALAQDIGLSSLNSVADTAGFKQITNPSLPDTLVGNIITWLLGFVGVIFLGLTVYSGVQWMTAGGNEDKVGEAKKRIINSIMGLVLVFFSFIIANTVFKFFYNQTNRQFDQPAEQGEGQMIACEHNSDCPIDQPQCVTEGIWRFCSCVSNADCTSVPGKPQCGDIALRVNRCVECASNASCSPGQYCDLTSYTCLVAECFNDAGCQPDYACFDYHCYNFD